jgi:hypothetical protein
MASEEKTTSALWALIAVPVTFFAAASLPVRQREHRGGCRGPSGRSPGTPEDARVPRQKGRGSYEGPVDMVFADGPAPDFADKLQLFG